MTKFTWNDCFLSGSKELNSKATKGVQPVIFLGAVVLSKRPIFSRVWTFEILQILQSMAKQGDSDHSLEILGILGGFFLFFLWGGGEGACSDVWLNLKWTFWTGSPEITIFPVSHGRKRMSHGTMLLALREGNFRPPSRNKCLPWRR